MPIVHNRFFTAEVADKTATLPAEIALIQNPYLAFDFAGFSGALDIQGRASADHAWENVQYVQITGDGALAVVNDQISLTTVTAVRTYQVRGSYPEMRVVMTRTAGTLDAGEVYGFGDGQFSMSQVSVTGTVDTELPAAAAAGDTMSNPTAPQVLGHLMAWDASSSVWRRAQMATSDAIVLAGPVAAGNLVFNGTTWSLMRGDITNGVDVDVTRSVIPTGYTTTGDGRKTVTTAATREQMSAQACKSVLITAETDNTGIVVVGGSTVVAALATRQGTPLNAGDSAVFPVSNVNLLYLDVTVSGDGVTFTWFN